MAGMPPRRGGCGVAMVRVTPRATVQPCVYWPGGGAPLDLLLDLGADIVDTDAFAAVTRSVPAACTGCSHLPTCGGGCAGRAAAHRRDRQAGSLLPGGARRETHAEGSHGDEPRIAQAGERLHHHCNGSRPIAAQGLHRGAGSRSVTHRVLEGGFVCLSPSALYLGRLLKYALQESEVFAIGSAHCCRHERCDKSRKSNWFSSIAQGHQRSIVIGRFPRVGCLHGEWSF
jgi:radical SAM protein with 4Fe4S-binding SPASM domain